MTYELPPELMITPQQQAQIGHDPRLRERINGLYTRIADVAMNVCTKPATDDDLPTGRSMSSARSHTASEWTALATDSDVGGDVLGRLHLAQGSNGGQQHNWVLAESMLRSPEGRQSAATEIASFSGLVHPEDPEVFATIGYRDRVPLFVAPFLLPVAEEYVRRFEDNFQAVE